MKLDNQRSPSGEGFTFALTLNDIDYYMAYKVLGPDGFEKIKRMMESTLISSRLSGLVEMASAIEEQQYTVKTLKIEQDGIVKEEIEGIDPSGIASQEPEVPQDLPNVRIPGIDSEECSNRAKTDTLPGCIEHWDETTRHSCKGRLDCPLYKPWRNRDGKL